MGQHTDRLIGFLRRIRERLLAKWQGHDASMSSKGLEEGHWDLPAALAKAATDCPFHYLVVLRDGTAIHCSGVIRSRPGWLVLTEPGKPDCSMSEPTPRSDWLWGCWLPRNLEVRISDIMACADAPHGS